MPDHLIGASTLLLTPAKVVAAQSSHPVGAPLMARHSQAREFIEGPLACREQLAAVFC